MTGKDVLPEKDLLEKAATIKRFEYSLLGKELKKKTKVAEKQYQGLNKFFKPDEKEGPLEIKEEKPEIISDTKIVYDNKYGFSYFKNVKKYSNLSLESKYYKLLSFYH